MNYKILKLNPFFVPLFLMLALPGCVKTKDATFNDFSKLNDFVFLQNSDLSNFDFAANIIITPSTTDTIKLDLYIGLASVNATGSDISVTLTIDDTKRTTYNTANPGSDFLAFTTNMYKLKDSKVVIKTGTKYVKTVLEIYSATVDVSKSWMLPVSINDASGKPLTTNLNTMYYHIVGNPLAGDYTWDFYRWNNSTGTGPFEAGSFFGDIATFLAESANAIEVASGYFIQPRYVLSFSYSGGVYSNFQVSMHPDDLAALDASGVIVTDGPNILLADPMAGHFQFQYVVFNGSANRYLIDDYYK